MALGTMSLLLLCERMAEWYDPHNLVLGTVRFS
jgi:hypothetical protein